MTTIQEMNEIGIAELEEFCFKYNVGISIGNDGRIEGIIPLMQVNRK